jgi:hypothetical protein
MRFLLLLSLLFITSCGVVPKAQKNKISPKSGIEKAYEETLSTECKLTVKDLLSYACYLSGKGCSLLSTLPKECLSIKVNNAEFVQSLKQKQRECFPANLKGSSKEEIGKELYKKAYKILAENYCL